MSILSTILLERNLTMDEDDIPFDTGKQPPTTRHDKPSATPLEDLMAAWIWGGGDGDAARAVDAMIMSYQEWQEHKE